MSQPQGPLHDFVTAFAKYKLNKWSQKIKDKETFQTISRERIIVYLRTQSRLSAAFSMVD